MKLTQGIWVVGEYDGIEDRTVTPKPDGRQFDPFKVEGVRLIVNDEPRVVEYREGKRPLAIGSMELGEVIVVPVRVREVFNGSPRFDGRSADIWPND